MNDLKQQLAPSWSPVNIGLAVILYILTGLPLALLMIAYIVWGKQAGLDLSQPHTLSTFGRRIVTAWKAAIAAFSGNGPSSRP